MSMKNQCAPIDRAYLAAQITAVTHISGEFTLRSGQTSQHYFDKYQFESRPELLSMVVMGLSELVPNDTMGEFLNA